MSDERRYREDEVREIFETAARERQVRERAVVSEEGLTLPELQAIGREVGLAPDRIAEAAAALERRPVQRPRRSYLGLPVGVGRTVELPRAPTDREWELLVAELRDTFQALGEVESHGSIRQWTNGNLHAIVEPTGDGHRLRLGTLKGSAMEVGTVGIVMTVMGLLILLGLLLTGELADKIVAPLFMGGMGLAALAYAAISLPGWAREREEQMEHIAARASTLLESPPDAAGG